MRKREREFMAEWGDLSIYNSEVGRGLVHTPEMDARMVEKQARYNAEYLGYGSG